MKLSLTVVLLLAPVSLLVAQEYGARYRLTFVAEWSLENHPEDFPPGAHFSRLIGATHEAGSPLWQPDGLATEGIEVMAESGGITPLSDEVNELILQGQAEFLLSGPGADGVDMVSFEFNVSLSHPHLSLVTMIAPSPDWFVGVHDLSLLQNNRWVEQQMVELLPYDAGTDSGMDFDSADQDVTPHEPIRRIIQSPFSNGNSLGVFFLERLSITGISPDDVFADGFE